MRYRTVEKTKSVYLRQERRSVIQITKFPFKDSEGNLIVNDRRITHSVGTEGLDVTETNISQIEFDPLLLTHESLIGVITSIEEHGYDLDDFEFSTQHTQSYKQGYLNPKVIMYAYRISTGIEISYILGCDPEFTKAFTDDLNAGFFEK